MRQQPRGGAPLEYDEEIRNCCQSHKLCHFNELENILRYIILSENPQCGILSPLFFFPDEVDILPLSENGLVGGRQLKLVAQSVNFLGH